MEMAIKVVFSSSLKKKFKKELNKNRARYFERKTIIPDQKNSQLKICFVKPRVHALHRLSTVHSRAERHSAAQFFQFNSIFVRAYEKNKYDKNN